MDLHWEIHCKDNDIITEMLDTSLIHGYLAVDSLPECQLTETDVPLKPGVKLPFDIFEIAMDFTDQHTKLAKGLTCKRLNRIATNKLLKKIIVLNLVHKYTYHPVIDCWTGVPMVSSVS